MTLFTKTDRQMEFEKMVFCRFSFPAFHCWPDAPDYCAFLRSTHRHVFHVEVGFYVSHNNRDIEFITKKQEIEDYIRGKYGNEHMGAMSCEMLAEELIEVFNAEYAEVNEDNENGAIVRRC